MGKASVRVDQVFHHHSGPHEYLGTLLEGIKK